MYDSSVCSYCKDHGHFRRECPKRKETVKEGKGKRAAFAGGLTFTMMELKKGKRESGRGKRFDVVNKNLMW